MKRRRRTRASSGCGQWLRCDRTASTYFYQTFDNKILLRADDEFSICPKSVVSTAPAG
jgi:hypothetical protein